MLKKLDEAAAKTLSVLPGSADSKDIKVNPFLFLSHQIIKMKIPSSKTSASTILPSIPNNTSIFKEESSIADVSRLIANTLKDVSGTFDINGDWVLCDVGGTFLPSCREMEVVLGTGSVLPAFERFGDTQFTKQDFVINFDGLVHRLYYESLRRNTNIQFFSIELSGQGAFELNILAQTETQQLCIASMIFELDKETERYISDSIEANTLPANGSLVVSLRCLSDSGFISNFRWKGHVRPNLINAGERVIAIRTFGNRASVAASLKAIVNRLSDTHPQILKRTLFVIYDATGDDTGGVISDYVHNVRMIEMSAPNYGGGGNASALVSMILRAGKISDKKISEVILFDDDAHIDAETIVRHDAFVTARKAGVVSTAVIYSRQRPTVIQEFGGIWGKFFSEANHDIAITCKDTPRLYFPYLVRSTRDIGVQHHAKFIGKHQDVEFSTFIFISFPYECLSKAGAPLPVFLRNDDAEICLRMLSNGYKVVVNPNLSAWHDSAHNPIGEFYATLHGLIINSRYGGISRPYFYRVFMERISCLARVGNLVMLVAYAKALELYATGPDWMQPQSIYDVYGQIRIVISKIMAQDASQVPFEVVDVLKTDNRLDVRSIVDPTPRAPSTADVVFVDTKEDAYYSFKHTGLDARLTQLLEQCIDQLQIISNNFDTLTTAWSDYVSDFDHDSFWNELLGKSGIWITGVREYDDTFQKPECKTNQDSVNKQAFFSSAIFSVNHTKNDQLPGNFDPENYLRLNPDVASEGFDPEEHWIKYGRHENRQY
ncbi:MAG: hypothetical protein Q8L68_00285 [Methylococcales bacterium]|nr:hypothetical protein [Methylococcales bacterium]